MDDWSNKEPVDLLSFIPYKMKLSFELQDFELLLPANEYNWVDCATKRKENGIKFFFEHLCSMILLLNCCSSVSVKVCLSWLRKEAECTLTLLP